MILLNIPMVEMFLVINNQRSKGKLMVIKKIINNIEIKGNLSRRDFRPFDLKTLWDMTYKNDEVAKIVREYSRKMYGRKKEYVDMEIEARLGIGQTTSATPTPS